MMTEIRYAPLVRILSLCGVLVCGGIAFLGWQVYRTEGTLGGLIVLIVMSAIGLYGLWALAASPQTVRFEADRLVVGRWIGTRTIGYAEIVAIAESYRIISIITQHGVLRLHKLFANDDARLMTALETYVPAARQAREERLSSGLPIVVRGGRAAPLLTGCGGMGMMIVGVLSGWYALDQASALDVGSLLFGVLFGLTSAGLGALLLYLLVWTYPRRTVFTADGLTQHFLLRTTTQSMRGVIDIRPGHEVRTVRSIPQRIYFITFHYADGGIFKWMPDEFDFPLNYVDAAARRHVNDLIEQLRRAYGRVVKTEQVSQ